METLKYCKVRNVKNPNRAHDGDAGIDFYMPYDLDSDILADKGKVTNCININFSLNDNYCIDTITLQPKESILIPSGIKVNVPYGYALVFMNKSGIAAKKHLYVGSSVVDYGYEGECHIHLTNVGHEAVTINAGDKIVQGVLLPISTVMPEEVPSEKELFTENSSRGSGGFGSTGNN